MKMVVRDRRKKQQRQERHLEKAVVRSVEVDSALRRAEEEHKRKIVEIENEDGPRGSEAETELKRQNQDEQPDENMDHPSDDVRGTKKRQETKENMRRKRQDGVIVSCLREEEATRRDIHP